MIEKSHRGVQAKAPTLSLPRFASLAGEGTLMTNARAMRMKRGVCSLSREAGEGWGGGLS
jgi:hypothetical protein